MDAKSVLLATKIVRAVELEFRAYGPLNSPSGSERFERAAHDAGQAVHRILEGRGDG